jgi:hypothetical protein
MSLSVSSSRFLFAAVYAAAGLLLLDLGAELAATLYPFSVGDVDWRFGAFGLVIGRTTTTVLADALIFLAAIGSGHRTFLKVWGAVHLVVAVAVLATLAMFSLDVLELRRRVRPDAAGTLMLSSVRAGVVAAVASIYCLWAGIAVLRTQGARARGLEAPLLVQRQG